MKAVGRERTLTIILDKSLKRVEKTSFVKELEIDIYLLEELAEKEDANILTYVIDGRRTIIGLRFFIR